MDVAYINNIATAVPDHDIHRKFIEYASVRLPDDESRKIFLRLAGRSHIDHRYSVIEAAPQDGTIEDGPFYHREKIPGTAERMTAYNKLAFPLARRALDRLDLKGVTHLVVTTCTGFYAPGLDIDILRHYRLDPSTERTLIGFMGCHAAFNALKMARHIVLAQSAAKVLIVNLELCTLHLNPQGTLDEMLSFLLFGDGCAACIVSADPSGLSMASFQTAFIHDTAERIQWKIGDRGFDMTLCGRVPALISGYVSNLLERHLSGYPHKDMTHWAIHPGGRAILDAVRDGGGVPEAGLGPSRHVLRQFGNMSSATIIFVLREILEKGGPGEGLALGFGPGMTVESMRFACGKRR
jgi:alpha-pyrone synthase